MWECLICSRPLCRIPFPLRRDSAIVPPLPSLGHCSRHKGCHDHSARLPGVFTQSHLDEVTLNDKIAQPFMASVYSYPRPNGSLKATGPNANTLSTVVLFFMSTYFIIAEFRLALQCVKEIKTLSEADVVSAPLISRENIVPTPSSPFSSLPCRAAVSSMCQHSCLSIRDPRQINCSRAIQKFLLASVLILAAFYVFLTQRVEGFARLGQIDHKLITEDALSNSTSTSEPVHAVVPTVTIHPKALPELTYVAIPTVIHPKVLPKPKPVNHANTTTAVLVMAATRAAAIRNHLKQLLRYRPDIDQFPVIVSQDGDDEVVARAIQEFISDEKRVYSIRHPNRTGINSPAHRSAKNYFFIAQHYKFALDEVFLNRGYKTAIITEDDLDIAEDFFSYFRATRHLLFEDPTIWCISAWNHNGNPSLVDLDHSEQLYRSDFFTGLGWMLTAETWKELSSNWPEAYWDDWLQRANIRKDRVCIRPEVSRTSHNMLLAGSGSSNGMYADYLKLNTLPDRPVDFSLINTDYLRKDVYDAKMDRALRTSKKVSLDDLISRTDQTVANKEITYRVIYKDNADFHSIAKAFGLMFDVRGGMTRTAYFGVVTFMVAGARVYAVNANLDMTEPFGTQNLTEIYSDEWII